jgi:hypothetical protein
LRERDRLQIREWNEAEAAREAAEREERERPIREATEQANELHRKIHATVRERVASLVDEDGRWADPIHIGTVMSEDDCRRYNGQQALIFVRDNPDLYWNRANMEAVIAYMVRNGINIASAETFRRTYMRLAEFGLLETAPEPEPTPEPEPLPIAPPPPEVFEGIDLETGEPKVYTKYQVDRMGSDEFLRVFRIGKVDGMPRPMRSV